MELRSIFGELRVDEPLEPLELHVDEPLELPLEPRRDADVVVDPAALDDPELAKAAEKNVKAAKHNGLARFIDDEPAYLGDVRNELRDVRAHINSNDVEVLGVRKFVVAKPKFAVTSSGWPSPTPRRARRPPATSSSTS